MADEPTVVVVGGTSGIGLALARRYAGQGRKVVITGRDPERTGKVAGDVGGDTSGIGVDLSRPEEIEDAFRPVGEVDRLVILAVKRDENTVRDYRIDGARMLATLKLVGYTEVVHVLAPRMPSDSSIVLFGGLAKDRPYPGSTTVTTVNGAVMTMINTLALELAPIRVNAVHPAVVGDTPYWQDKPEAVLQALVDRTPLGRLVTTDEVVEATVSLLENPALTGVNLRVDGGWMLT